MTIQFITLIISIIIFSIICVILGKLESAQKYKDLFESRDWESLILVIAIYSITSGYTISLIDSNDYIPAIAIAFIFRVFLAFKTFSVSERLNRNAQLWIILGLIDPLSAMIGLTANGKSHKVNLQNKNVIKQINSETNIKIKKLFELRNLSILTQDELNEKISDIREQYYENINHHNEETISHTKIDYLNKIEQAYEDGLLTEEEYRQKLKN